MALNHHLRSHAELMDRVYALELEDQPWESDPVLNQALEMFLNSIHKRTPCELCGVLIFQNWLDATGEKYADHPNGEQLAANEMNGYI